MLPLFLNLALVSQATEISLFWDKFRGLLPTGSYVGEESHSSLIHVLQVSFPG